MKENFLLGFAFSLGVVLMLFGLAIGAHAYVQEFLANREKRLNRLDGK